LFFVVFIALLATSEKASNKDVWGTFINQGGWSSDGVSFCLGFLTPAFALAGVDAVVHMSEETHNAPVNIPRAMIGRLSFLYLKDLQECLYLVENTSLGYLRLLLVGNDQEGSSRSKS
jgi:amino acid transporter